MELLYPKKAPLNTICKAKTLAMLSSINGKSLEFFKVCSYIIFLEQLDIIFSLEFITVFLGLCKLF